jgi:hypothetical protein
LAGIKISSSVLRGWAAQRRSLAWISSSVLRRGQHGAAVLAACLRGHRHASGARLLPLGDVVDMQQQCQAQHLCVVLLLLAGTGQAGRAGSPEGQQ